MKQQNTPFRAGWWSFDLGRFRPCNGTYCFYDYDSIPPVDITQFNGNFDWLKPWADGETFVSAAPVPETPLKTKFASLQVSAKKLDLTLPAPFVTFMQNEKWHDFIPSCTACYFDTTDPIADSLQEKHFYIPFLYDQQDVLIWYLYLNTDGDSCVVVSPIYLQDIDEDEIPKDAIKNHTVYCGELFEAFIYRYWLENTIWFALEDADKLSQTQKSYLAHYQKP